MRTKFLALAVFLILLLPLLLQACTPTCKCEWNDVEVSWWDATTSQSKLWVGNCGDSLSLTICQGGNICIDSSINCTPSPSPGQPYYNWVVTGPQAYERTGTALPICFEPPQGGNYHLELSGSCECYQDGVSYCNNCTLNMAVNLTMPQCESEEFIACDCDSFNATKPDAQNAPSAALLDWIDAHYYYNGTRACDEGGYDQYWAHTFTGLCKPCCHIVGASLEITIWNQDDNDSLMVGFISSNTSTWEVNKALDWTGWPGGGIPVYSNGTITLDLSNVYLGNNTTINLLSAIESNCFLDVAVQDDSAVDCARLIITYSPV